MLLIVSNTADATVDFTLPSLVREGVEFWRLDTDRYPHDAELFVDVNEARLTISEQVIDFAQVSAVWWRRPLPPVIEGRSDAVARWAAEEARVALDGAWRDATHAHWVNHPDDNRRAQDKLGQLRAAAALGLEVPDWLVTNQASAAREFVRRHPGGVVAKPLGGGRIDDGITFWTTLVSEEDLHRVGPEPYLFQRFIPRETDIRVVVVGDDVFAVAIDASGQPEARADWRRAGVDADHRIIELQPAASELCRALCRAYNLSFAAIDLALEGDDEMRFFEINPNGQWAWLEQATGVPIARALARLFASS